MCGGAIESRFLVTQVQTSIENLERSVQRRRQEGQAAQQRLEEFRDVLEVVKNTLGNGAGALTRKRAENANLTAQIEEKRSSLEAARRKYQVMAEFRRGATGEAGRSPCVSTVRELLD